MDLRRARSSAAHLAQHPRWPLVLEPVQDAIHPLGRQMPSPVAYLVCDLIEVARCMGKVEHAQRVLPMALRHPSWIHSAPSWMAQTRLARSMPRLRPSPASLTPKPPASPPTPHVPT